MGLPLLLTALLKSEFCFRSSVSLPLAYPLEIALLRLIV